MAYLIATSGVQRTVRNDIPETIFRLISGVIGVKQRSS